MAGSTTRRGDARSTDGRGGTRAAETAARKQRLLSAAAELAAEGGYDAVQMRDVAARAEVALGTLYRHYASKDQLLLAALSEQATSLRERLDQRPPRGDAPADRVADVLRRATRALERQPRVTHAMLTAMSVADDSAAPLKHEINDTLRAIIGDAIGETPVAGLDDIVRLLGSVWFAELTFWSGGMTDANAMADHLARAAALVLGNQ